MKGSAFTFQVNHVWHLFSFALFTVPWWELPSLGEMRANNLAATRAAERQDQNEDGLDLKTPTQEDLDGLPSGSDGSSSGYGSQNTVKMEDQGLADGK